MADSLLICRACNAGAVAKPGEKCPDICWQCKSVNSVWIQTAETAAFLQTKDQWEMAPGLAAKIQEWSQCPGEVRITDPITGGQKGSKPERLGLIPPEALLELGRVYGHGAKKYADDNYLKGYSWRLSIDALERHIAAFKMRQDKDQESGLHHLAHAAWHCFALMMFGFHGLGTDDRWTPPKEKGNA